MYSIQGDGLLLENCRTNAVFTPGTIVGQQYDAVQQLLETYIPEVQRLTFQGNRDAYFAAVRAANDEAEITGARDANLDDAVKNTYQTFRTTVETILTKFLRVSRDDEYEARGRIIGRALSTAKPGKPFDIILGSYMA